MNIVVNQQYLKWLSGGVVSECIFPLGDQKNIYDSACICGGGKG